MQDSESSSTWPGRAGPSKNVSDRPKTTSDSTTTKSVPGTPGTGISPSSCSPTPSSPSPHTTLKKGAPTHHTTSPAGQSIQHVDRTGNHSTHPPAPDRAHPRRNPPTAQPRPAQRTRNPPRPALVNLSALAPSASPP